jgi:hypothetical protein
VLRIARRHALPTLSLWTQLIEAFERETSSYTDDENSILAVDGRVGELVLGAQFWWGGAGVMAATARSAGPQECRRKQAERRPGHHRQPNQDVTHNLCTPLPHPRRVPIKTNHHAAFFLSDSITSSAYGVDPGHPSDRSGPVVQLARLISVARLRSGRTKYSVKVKKSASPAMLRVLDETW